MKHIVIGIGGTGGRIIRALRKSIIRDYPEGNGSPMERNSSGQLRLASPVGFLYVDSNEHDLRSEAGWEYLGRSVRLEEDELLHIREGNLGAALDQVAMNPAISRWLGDNQELRRIFKDTMGVPGANQIRRWGRFLFANSATRFRERITALKNCLDAEGGVANATFHICCTLAGGTGSGSVVDAIMQIRRAFPTGQGLDYPIQLYCLVTDAPCPAATGNFYANQYAALMELNALVTMNWHPHDVIGSGSRLDQLRDRFSVCNLITDKNREGVSIPVDRQEELVAEYLYNRTIAFPDHLNAEFAKTWTFEDVKPHPGEPARDPRRSYFFGSIGVKRWSVPITEVTERLTYECVASACWQMVFNRWEEGLGFANTPAHRDLEKFVSDAVTSGRWRLSEDQTLLRSNFELQSGGPLTPSWEDEWRNVVYAHSKEVETSNAKPATWLVQLRQQIDSHVREGFRGRGVDRWYDDRRAAVVSEYVLSVVGLIEDELWSSWRNGTLGWIDIQKLLDSLWRKLSAQIDGIDADEVETIKKRNDLESRLKTAAIEWAKIGWISATLGARQRALTSFQHLLVLYGTTRTRAAALPFQRQLLAEVKNRVTTLLDGVNSILQPFQNLAREMEDQARVRGVEGYERQFHELVVREYDPKTLATVASEIRKQLTVQQPLAQSCRDAFDQALAPEPGVLAFDRWLRQQRLNSHLTPRASEAVERAHTQLTQGGALPPVLDLGIVEKLRLRYGSQPGDALRTDVETFLKNAATAAMLDLTQLQPRDAIGNPLLPDMPRRRSLVFIPGGANQTTPGANEIVERFRRAGQPDILGSRRKEEITVLTAEYWMAARFFRVVQGLKSRYEQRIGTNETAAKREIHLEDHERRLPDLLLESGESNSQDGRALLLLGELLGAIVERPGNGTSEIVWEIRDINGMALKMEPLAEKRDHFGSLSLPELHRLRERVSDLIQKEAEGTANGRKAFIEATKQKIRAERHKFWEGCGSTPQARNANAEFVAFGKICDRAESLVDDLFQ